MPSWTEEQLQAIHNEGTNIIVSAGAGSGKTAVLTERVITKIRKGIPVDHLLILTFTKAAANEMKERIRAAIKKEGNIGQLNLLDSAYITTFDSFALSVVKKYHYLINVSKNINIGNENIFKLQKNKILDEIFEDLYGKRDKAFTKLINDLCVKDDNEIRTYILNLREKLDMKVDSNEYLNHYLEKYYDESHLQNLIAEYVSLINKKKDEISFLLKDISYYVDSNYLEKLENVLNPLLSSISYIDVKSNLNFRLPSLPRGSEEVVKNKKDDINSIVKSLKELTVYESTDEILSSLKDTKDYARIIIDILLEFDSKTKEFKFKNDIYEFNDIAMMAIKILEENEDVCSELKEYFNEILIDEYQDTSDIQETFINLIANNNVYMVGDIKQSIYRFRNANPYIFKNKYDNYSNHEGGNKIDLNKNFRSRSEVINNINLIFNYIMGDNVGGANYKSTHQMIFGNKSYIDYANPNMDILKYNNETTFKNNEIEAFIIAHDIKNKLENNYQVFDKKNSILRDAKYSDFVILMDRTTDFELYKKIFEYLNIPLAIYKDEILNNEMDTIVLSNLVELIKLIKEHDFKARFRYLFTSIARSFLFRLTDNEILNKLENNTFYDTEIFKKCSNIAENLDCLTPKEFVENVIEEFEFYKNIIKIGNIESCIVRLEYIINLSNDLMNLGYDSYKFVEYLKNINELDYQMKYSVNTGNVDAVKIMTIHKSKGLEYPICYFSGLYKTFNISDLKERILYDNYFGIILPYFNEGINESICKVMLKDRFIKEEISEKIRLLYVAVTRAREKMIFVLPSFNNSFPVEKELEDNIKLRYRSLADIINSLGNILDDYSCSVDLDSLNLSTDYNIVSTKTLESNKAVEKIIVDELNIQNEILQNSSFSKKTNNIFSKEEQDNIKLGLEIHKILENIDFHNPDLTLIENNYYRKVIENLFSKIDIKKDTKIYQEYEFIYEENNNEYHGIVDLILEYSDYIDIIDYKLKYVIDDAYKNQLIGYKNYISTLTDKKINTYLYSIIDNEFTKLDI